MYTISTNMDVIKISIIKPPYVIENTGVIRNCFLRIFVYPISTNICDLEFYCQATLDTM